MRRIRLGHLFPELLNLYADRGNIAAIVQRAAWRGITVQVDAISLGTPIDFDAYDLLLLGGGSDREQEIIGRELNSYRYGLREAVEKGLPVLAICGGYQLIGEYYVTSDGQRVSGLSIVASRTEAGEGRLIGNILIESPWMDNRTIVGFENHGGRTYHDYPPLGMVRTGHGNNGEDGKEGIHYRELIGTYIHGPLLPKNPNLTDAILRSALAYRGLDDTLSPLDDSLELLAHQTMVGRLSNG